MSKLFRKDIVTFLLLLLLSVPLTLQTFTPGFFVGDDGEWMIIRSSAFHETLRDGQFPVRTLGRLNHDYGYPVATFLYPGYLYLTEPLIIAGFDFVTSIKIMYALTMVLSGIFAFLWLRKLFDRWIALVGALMYLYTPYHLVDIYVRGSLGELLALAVVPFILWQIERRSIVFTSLGLATLLLSHNIMAALFLPIMLFYAYLRVGKTIQSRILFIIQTLLISLGLSAFFWIPALFELKYTVFSSTKIADWELYFTSYDRIGGLQIVVLATGVLVLIFSVLRQTKHAFFKITQFKTVLIFFTALGLLSVFFSSSLSKQFWHILPVTFIQFPFRFLSVEIVAVAFVSSCILYSIQGKTYRFIYAVILLSGLLVNAIPFFQQIKPYNKGEGFYITNQSTTTTRDEYMPVWVKEKPLVMADEKVLIKKGKGEISDISVTNKQITFTIHAATESIVQINKIYWPDWKAFIKEKELPIDYKNFQGVMTVQVPEGRHTVTLQFGETPLRLFADLVSIFSVLSLAAVVLLQRKNSIIKKR